VGGGGIGQVTIEETGIALRLGGAACEWPD